MVSVIIPVYNCAEYIKQSLESVLSQTYTDFEVIIVDDGSTDATQEVLKPYLNRIKYVKQQNMGASVARNTGIGLAKGDYTAFLDADDIWLPEKLQRQIDYFKANPELSLVFSNISFIDKNGVPTLLDDKRPFKFYSGKVFYNLLFRNFVPTSAAMVKKECLIKVGGFNSRFKCSEDYELWLRLARYYSFGFIDEMLARHRILSTGLTAQNVYNMYQTHIEIVKWMAELFPELGLKESSAWKRGIAEHHFEFGLEYFFTNNFISAREQFCNSLIYAPYNLKVFLYMFCTFLPPKVIEAARYIL